ncbi:ribbon-helix-helix domain-containing protein [Ottowia sp. GY511]|uniref:Ribbon-helix-helix domain-containing protein n=1 Tax=Ottowia flava TaxID=2675430 RepID=A0ABW4KRB7_9BURK|nr:ribbon-helix-helix domain-containing protein [Ottowia sp. GY511]
MRRMNIFFPEPLIAALKALSKNTGLPVSEHIRRAIDEYLKRQ